MSRALKEIKEIVTEQPVPQVTSNNECCDVHHDCALAFCFCPCYAYCAAQAAGDSITASVCNCLFFPFCLCCLRQKVRLLRNIEGTQCTDCLVAILCSCCASIQIKREFEEKKDAL